MIVNGIERDYVIHDNKCIKGFFGEYRWLSNFHKCEIYFDGLKFPSTENAYVYAKIPPELREIKTSIIEELLICEPSVSKKIGREMYLRPDWESIKFDVMSAVVFDKFYRHLDLRKELLNTGTKYIEETNHWSDFIYGVCNGKGENKLGKILMNIREYWFLQYPELRKNKVTKLF